MVTQTKQPFQSGWWGGKAIEPFVRMCEKDTMSNNDEMKAELERLRAENQALKKTTSRGLSMKVSEKGGLSVYGLGRFPVTLYKEQWIKLLDLADEIRSFIQQNDSKLKAKE